jgi:transcriptional regulator with XRE-family HTH domain
LSGGKRTRDTETIELGERVRHFRTHFGLTQEALARSADLTPKFVSQIENGRVNPSIGVLERMVHDGFGISLGAFFLWHPERADLSSTLALLARQPADHHRRIVRVIEVLCDHEPDGER